MKVLYGGQGRFGVGRWVEGLEFSEGVLRKIENMLFVVLWVEVLAEIQLDRGVEMPRVHEERVHPHNFRKPFE